ncbi:Rv1733c family protein [Kribbella karoonensis]|uniref:Transmembrane protein n=1 Tax=Kribbella karoonensis TaxID=324851 RepID=A0ABP4Q2A3_9ACTN
MNGSSSTLPRPVRERRRWTWLFRPNPLRRRTDKLQAAALAFCALVGAAAVPLVTLLALHVHRTTDADLHTAQQGATQTIATTTGAGRSPLGSSGPTSPTVAAPARWTTTTGDLRTGMIQVPADTPPGTNQQITITSDGHYLSKASAHGSTVVIPIVFGVTMLSVALLTCTLIYGAITSLLNRHRAAAWDTAWEDLARISAN